jgi:transposase-like protein
MSPPAFCDPDTARGFLETLIWPSGPFCPFCGSFHVWRFRAAGRSSRPGLHECADCNSQFTVTTRTPLHSTNLPLVTWIRALYRIVTSSKGIASPVLARWLGVSPPTAWKMAHALRELMDCRAQDEPALGGVVEIDTKAVGGAPKFQRHVYHPPGRGSDKPVVLIAVERGGQVRATVVPGAARADIEPVITAAVDPAAHLMSDQDKAVGAVGKGFAAHDTVKHSARQYARKGSTGKPKIPSNTAESFAVRWSGLRSACFTSSAIRSCTATSTRSPCAGTTRFASPIRTAKAGDACAPVLLPSSRNWPICSGMPSAGRCGAPKTAGSAGRCRLLPVSGSPLPRRPDTRPRPGISRRQRPSPDRTTMLLLFLGENLP